MIDAQDVSELRRSVQLALVQNDSNGIYKIEAKYLMDLLEYTADLQDEVAEVENELAESQRAVQELEDENAELVATMAGELDEEGIN